MLDDKELAAAMLAEFPAGCQSPASYRGYLNNPKHDMAWDTTDLPKAKADLVGQYDDPYLYSQIDFTSKQYDDHQVFWELPSTTARDHSVPTHFLAANG